MAFEREAGMLWEYGRFSAGMRQVLDQLDEEDRKILELLVIIPRPGNLDELCWLLDTTKSTIYRRRQRALSRFGELWRVWERENGWHWPGTTQKKYCGKITAERK